MGGTFTAVIQARMGSTRLPGKVLLPLAGRPTIEHVVSRVARARRIDKVVVATTDNPEDDVIEAWCRGAGVLVFRGSEWDVLSRYAGAIRTFGGDAVVRVTSDCPAVDPGIIDRCIQVFESEGADFASNTLRRSFPIGMDVETARCEVLFEADRNASEQFEREHVFPYITRRNDRFRCVDVLAESHESMHDLRTTLDTPADFIMLQCLFDSLGPEFGCAELVQFVQKHPWIREINRHVRHKVAFADLDPTLRRVRELSHAAKTCADLDLRLAATTLVRSGLEILEGESLGVPVFGSDGDPGVNLSDQIAALDQKIEAYALKTRVGTG